MTLPDFLVDHPDGEIRVTGHRIGLFHIVRYYNEGYSPEMLSEQFPTLSLALIHKVIAFYLENRAEVDVYVANYEAELEQQRSAAPKGPSLAELRRRLESLRQVEKA
jgi:uncharacterized protein (DUF433 family)